MITIFSAMEQAEAEFTRLAIVRELQDVEFRMGKLEDRSKKRKLRSNELHELEECEIMHELGNRVLRKVCKKLP
jgi:hypothetical protein